MIDEIDIVDAVDIDDAPEVFPLAVDEQQMLERCELIIGQGLQTYIEVGRAIATIRDGKLYRQHYDTWEEYCVDRWGISRARAYQLIDASKAADALSTIVDTSKIPESHMREVAKAKPADRPRVIARADQLAGSEKRTAKHIAQAAAEIAQPDLPIEFAVIQRRFESHGHVLSAAWDGHTQRFVVRKDGGTGAVLLWPAVLDRLERLEKEPSESPPPPPRPASATVAAYDAHERADEAILMDVTRLLDQARQMIGTVKVARWRADQLESEVAHEQAGAFSLTWRDRLTRFSEAAMVSQKTFTQALDHIDALIGART